ncbi:MAG: hypothetical protein JWM59_4817 [Verrucomicrobiales bacterium]|nr:hypothetical protein [Verrucomicrobiales bacterium]
MNHQVFQQGKSQLGIGQPGKVRRGFEIKTMHRLVSKRFRVGPGQWGLAHLPGTGKRHCRVILPPFTDGIQISLRARIMIEN